MKLLRRNRIWMALPTALAVAFATGLPGMAVACGSSTAPTATAASSAQPQAPRACGMSGEATCCCRSGSEAVSPTHHTGRSLASASCTCTVETPSAPVATEPKPAARPLAASPALLPTADRLLILPTGGLRLPQPASGPLRPPQRGADRSRAPPTAVTH